MSDLNTKEKILQASIKLFNEFGMANVRMQQIANDVGISPGNLAYHFKNKEAIIESINEVIELEGTSILSAYRMFPNLMDFDYQLTKYFEFIQKYPFYFIDLLDIDRAYPGMKLKRQIHVNKMISQIRNRFNYNLQRDIVVKEPRKDVYDSIATSIWELIAFWAPQNIVRGEEPEIEIKSFKELIWNQIYPYFTKQGITEYRQLIVPILLQYSSDDE